MVSFLWLVAVLGAVWPQGSAPSGCSAHPVSPGGPLTDSRFFEAPLERTREAVEDAMQAGGVFLIERNAVVVRGERTAPRISVLKLPPGDEAVFGHLEAAEQDGRPGTLVRVETRRRGGQRGEAGQSWSRAVLDETECLLRTFVAAPQGATALHGGAVSNAGADPGREVLVPAGTAVTLLLRRFLFSSELRVNQRIPFEVGADVSVGADVIIRRGAAGTARVKVAQDAQGAKAANARIEFEYVSAVSGDRLRVRDVVALAGQSNTLKGLAGGLLLPGWRIALSYGGEFALGAGTRFDVVIDGEQKVSVGRD